MSCPRDSEIPFYLGVDILFHRRFFLFPWVVDGFLKRKNGSLERMELEGAPGGLPFGPWPKHGPK